MGVFTQRPCSQVPLCASHIPESQEDPGITSDVVSTPAPRSCVWRDPCIGGSSGRCLEGLLWLWAPFCYFWVFLPRGWGAGRLRSISLERCMISLIPFFFSFFKTIFHLNNRVGLGFFLALPQGTGDLNSPTRHLTQAAYSGSMEL